MSYSLTVQIEAWHEIQNAYDWYEEQKPGLGEDLSNIQKSAIKIL